MRQCPARRRKVATSPVDRARHFKTAACAPAWRIDRLSEGSPDRSVDRSIDCANSGQAQWRIDGPIDRSTDQSPARSERSTKDSIRRRARRRDPALRRRTRRRGSLASGVQRRDRRDRSTRRWRERERARMKCKRSTSLPCPLAGFGLSDRSIDAPWLSVAVQPIARSLARSIDRRDLLRRRLSACAQYALIEGLEAGAGRGAVKDPPAGGVALDSLPREIFSPCHHQR